jgi:hypothetical protein
MFGFSIRVDIGGVPTGYYVYLYMDGSFDIGTSPVAPPKPGYPHHHHHDHKHDHNCCCCHCKDKDDKKDDDKKDRKKRQRQALINVLNNSDLFSNNEILSQNKLLNNILSFNDLDI